MIAFFRVVAIRRLHKLVTNFYAYKPQSAEISLIHDAWECCDIGVGSINKLGANHVYR